MSLPNDRSLVRHRGLVNLDLDFGNVPGWIAVGISVDLRELHLSGLAATPALAGAKVVARQIRDQRAARWIGTPSLPLSTIAGVLDAAGLRRNGSGLTS